MLCCSIKKLFNGYLSPFIVTNLATFNYSHGYGNCKDGMMQSIEKWMTELQNVVPPTKERVFETALPCNKSGYPRFLFHILLQTGHVSSTFSIGCIKTSESHCLYKA